MPLLSPATPITLEAALALTRSNNPDLKAKRKESGIAEGKLTQALLLFQHNPELSVRGASRRVSSSEQSDNSVDFGVELSQEFEVWGQPDARRLAAKAALDATVAEIEALEWETFARVRRQYYAVQIAQRRLSLTQRQFEFSRTILELSRRRLEAGDMAGPEFRQLEIQTARLNTELLEATAELLSAKTALRRSLGLAVGAPIVTVEELPAVIKPNASPSALIDEVLSVHPQIRHAHLVAVQHRREVSLKKMEAKPNITGSLSFEREEESQNLYGLGLAVPLPLFNLNQGEILTARAAVEVAEANIRAVTDSLQSQSHRAVERLTLSSEAALYYMENAVPAINSNLEELKKLFRRGRINMIDLRLSQRELLEGQVRALDILSEYFQWRAELEGLLGRGIETRAHGVDRER